MKNNKLYLDINENPKKLHHWILFAIQHVLACIVATITVPMLVPGLPVAATMVAAGVGTLAYIFITKGKSPVFLSSSFAYITPMMSAISIGLISTSSGQFNYLALILGMLIVGLIYIIVALIIKKAGTDWLNKLLPPVVAGPVIIVIGLSLAGSAIRNLVSSPSGYNLIYILCGLVALTVTSIVAHYKEGKTLGMIPFVIGIISGYALAAIITLIGYTWLNNEYFKVIDFTPIIKVWGNLKENIFNFNMFKPDTDESFIFLRFNEIKAFNWKAIGKVILLFAPVSLVTMCEHIGDHKNLGNIIGKNLLEDEPGITRTLIGDGVGTIISGALCGAADTTYGESVSVVATSKVASVNVIKLAALFMIIFGLFTPLTVVLETIPACVMGGCSIVLYGFIASSGVKMIINEKVNLEKTKNIFVMSAILVTGIGGFTLKFGSSGIEITSIAMSMLIGIFLNLILVDKKHPTTKFNHSYGLETEDVDNVYEYEISNSYLMESYKDIENRNVLFQNDMLRNMPNPEDVAVLKLNKNLDLSVISEIVDMLNIPGNETPTVKLWRFISDERALEENRRDVLLQIARLIDSNSKELKTGITMQTTKSEMIKKFADFVEVLCSIPKE